MKIKHAWRKGEYVSISTAVDARIDDGDTHSGIAEAALSNSRNAAGVIGDLIQMLHDKGLLQDEDVKKFIGYSYTVETE